jgi:signal transduction histidine kinase
MLPQIDARTLFVATAVIFGGLVVSVVLAWRELGKLKGPDRFAAAYVSFFAGLILFSMRGRIPDLASIVASNVLFVLGAALVLEGTRLFYGLRPTRRVTLAVPLASLPAFAWLTLVREDGANRTILSSALLAFLLGAAAWTIWRRRPRGGRQVLEPVTALALALCALLFWARAVAVGGRLVERELVWESPWMALPPLLCTLCAVVWTTALLANASRRLMAVVQSQNELLASLIAVTRAAGSASSLDATLRRVLDATRSLTGATGSSLLLLDERGRFSRGIFAEGDSALAVLPAEARELLDRGLAGWVVKNRQTALVHDVERDPRWHRLPSQGSAIRSALSAPIENGTALFGVLTLVHSSPEHFGEDQRHLLRSTTAQIALAIRTAQLDDARLRATRAKELVNAVLETSARRNDAGEIVAEAARSIAEGSTLPRVYLAVPGEDGHFRLSGRTLGLASLKPRINEGILGRALASGATERDEVPGEDDETGGGVSWRRLAVPLRHLGRSLGVAAFEIRAPRAFDEEDVALAEALAEAVSLGLGKADLARTREEMTRMTVHDLRGPISGVMGALELLGQNEALGDSDRRLLEAAERSVRRQLTLIEGILEVARLEDGALPVRHEVVDASGLVEEALRAMQPAAESRGLALETDVPANLPAVRVDPALVTRVLENLVGNAVKFTEPGAGPIRVGLRLDGTAVEVRVKDSGPGIEESVRPRVFEKFAVGTLPGRGSGLGLAFCRLAVEAQGGRIWLDEPGPGAVFAFTLPLAGHAAS